MSKKNRRTRAKSINRIAQQHPSNTGQPPAGLHRDTGMYMDAALAMLEDPAYAAEVAAIPEDTMWGLCAGIAWADELGLPDHECLDIAATVKLWAVLHQMDYMYEWPERVVSLSDQEFLDKLRADKAAGLIPKPEPFE